MKRFKVNKKRYRDSNIFANVTFIIVLVSVLLLIAGLINIIQPDPVYAQGGVSNEQLLQGQLLDKRGVNHTRDR